MLEDQASKQPEAVAVSEKSGSFHWQSALQLGVGLLATLGLWFAALAMIFLGISGIAVPSLNTDVTSLFLLASGLALCGLLILPAVGYASARLFNRKFSVPPWLERINWLYAALLFFLFIAVVLVGHLISSLEIISWVLLPLFHLIALGVPIVLLLWLGVRGLSLREPETAWGIFATGLVVSPALILILEMIAGGIVLGIAFTFLSMDQQALAELQTLLGQVNSAGENIDVVIGLIEPYLTRPAIMFTIFAFAAGIVPIIEETLKPLGVWLLPGKGTSPVEGFIAGLMCGAGYALFENLALASQAEGWAFAVSARAFTSLLHMVTTGLMGWALVLAWRRASYGLLLLVYLTSITIHGLWNGLALLSFTNFLNLPDDHPLLIVQQVGIAAPVGLIALTLASLLILLAANRYFKPQPKEGSLLT